MATDQSGVFPLGYFDELKELIEKICDHLNPHKTIDGIIFTSMDLRVPSRFRVPIDPNNSYGYIQFFLRIVKDTAYFETQGRYPEQQMVLDHYSNGFQSDSPLTGSNLWLWKLDGFMERGGIPADYDSRVRENIQIPPNSSPFPRKSDKGNGPLPIPTKDRNGRVYGQVNPELISDSNYSSEHGFLFGSVGSQEFGLTFTQPFRPVRYELGFRFTPKT